jgi:ribosomal protein S18 acetylase RimI-like enzyme
MIEIRAAARGDAALIQQMLVAMAHDLGQASDYRGSADAIERYGFSDNPAFHVLLAFEGDTPLGMILFFYEFSTWRGRPGLYVQDIYVASAARGIGLGRKLIAAAVTEASKRGAVYLRLSVHTNNEGGTGFYDQLGFRHAVHEKMMVLEGKAFEAMGES